MAERARARADFVPHLPDLIVTTAECWRAIRDAQTEVDPFGRSYDALGEVRASLETLAYVLTGQREFLALRGAAGPVVAMESAIPSADGDPF